MYEYEKISRAFTLKSTTELDPKEHKKCPKASSIFVKFDYFHQKATEFSDQLDDYQAKVIKNRYDRKSN